jgi:uncharacterized protein YegL
MPADFYGKKGMKIRLSGSFCPTMPTSGDITVLFVVDHSGSMEGAPDEGPNDKTTNGTCGRLQSAQSIVNKYASFANLAVHAGVVGFSNDARVQLPVADLATMKSNLTADVFCGSDSPVAATNYQAAFNLASSQLSSVTGTKIVYFISDGDPTIGGFDPHQAGLTAAQSLRSQTNLTLYVLFVGYQYGSANDPKGYLEQIAGDPALLRVTGSAEELVHAAGTEAQPSISIAAADTKATLDASGQSKSVAIDKLVRRSDVFNNYTWTTEPIELIGELNKDVLNTLTVTAKTSTGDTLQTTAKVTYHERDK